MISHLIYYQLVILVLLWLCVMPPPLAELTPWDAQDTSQFHKRMLNALRSGDFFGKMPSLREPPSRQRR